MRALPNDFNEGPFSVYAGAVNFTICGPGGFTYPVDSERYAWHYVAMLNEAFAAWVKDAEQIAEAQSALIAIATKKSDERIAQLERDMVAIAELYEKYVDRCGSHEMVMNAYDMRCIARSALNDKP
jgi:hypothetical protein